MLRIAIVGCAHGELDKIYATVRHIQQSENLKIDLLLCCGDFQAVRNERDLEVLACPPKFRSMNTFWKYYSGQETAPCTTVFIGGNHEASNYLWELYYGGWVAPNIYYLGAAGVITFGGLRIGGLSGIYKQHDYHSGHFERLPFNESEKRSVYHIREYEVQKLMQIGQSIDIFMSHDWPRGVAHCGDMQKLLKYKPFLQKEIADNVLGSEPANKLLLKLKPSYWFSAHLHTKFAAVVHHAGDDQVTKFLALDKCLPGRPFLQVLEFPVASDDDLEIKYDKEWLAITRAYHSCFPLKKTSNVQMCWDMHSHREWIEEQVSRGELSLRPSLFCKTAPAFDPLKKLKGVAEHVRNPQTENLLRLLNLDYVLDKSVPQAIENDPNEIALEDDDTEDKEDAEEITLMDETTKKDEDTKTHKEDPNEITLTDGSTDDSNVIPVDEDTKIRMSPDEEDPNEISLVDETTDR